MRKREEIKVIKKQVDDLVRENNIIQDLINISYSFFDLNDFKKYLKYKHSNNQLLLDSARRSLLIRK